MLLLNFNSFTHKVQARWFCTFSRPQQSVRNSAARDVACALTQCAAHHTPAAQTCLLANDYACIDKHLFGCIQALMEALQDQLLFLRRELKIYFMCSTDLKYKKCYQQI